MYYVYESILSEDIQLLVINLDNLELSRYDFDTFKLLYFKEPDKYMNVEGINSNNIEYYDVKIYDLAFPKNIHVKNILDYYSLEDFKIHGVSYKFEINKFKKAIVISGGKNIVEIIAREEQFLDDLQLKFMFVYEKLLFIGLFIFNIFSINVIYDLEDDCFVDCEGGHFIYEKIGFNNNSTYNVMLNCVLDSKYKELRGLC